MYSNERIQNNIGKKLKKVCPTKPLQTLPEMQEKLSSRKRKKALAARSTKMIFHFTIVYFSYVQCIKKQIAEDFQGKKIQVISFPYMDSHALVVNHKLP